MSLIQGQNALASLRESLRIVLDDNYVPPSPLREVAANRSVDQLAPNDPVAAEMAQMRETLEEIRRRVMRRTPAIPTSVVRDIDALRAVIRRNLTYLDQEDFDMLSTDETSRGQDAWTEELRRQSSSGDDSEYSDEPPF